MKDKKCQIARYAFYDQNAMQNHFEKMASEGWLIEKVSPYFWQYRRIEPQKLSIAIAYFPDGSEFEAGPTIGEQILEDYAAKDGWNLITRSGQMQVFCNYAEEATPIETDPVTQVETIHCAMKKNIIPSLLLILGLTIYQLVFNTYEAFCDTVNFLSTPYLLAAFPVWLLVLFVEINILATYFLWYRKAKKFANNGIFVPVKTKHFITFMLLLSCVFLVVSMFKLPVQMRMISIVLIAVIIGIILIGHIVKHGLKKCGATRGINYIVTILTTMLLTFVLLVGMTFYIVQYINDGRDPVGSYEINGETFNIYNEQMPLYVEDLIDIGDSEWSRECNNHKETFLVSKSQYRQKYVQGGPKALKDLEYTIVDIKMPVLYDAVKQSMLNERQDEVHGDYIFIDHFEPIDAVSWDAIEVYQLHWSEGILNTYLVCWDTRIIEIKFYWEPTPEQIAVVVNKLKN